MNLLLRSPSQIVNPLDSRRRFGFGSGVSGAEAFIGPLDAYASGLAGAWSVSRRLLATYTGPLFRVRRSSDSTEQDINATAAGLVDTTALLAFCGSGSGFIRTVYDQKTGTALNLDQTTALSQPRIVNAGSVELYGMSFDGSNDCLDTSSQAWSTFGGTQAVQMVVKQRMPSSGNTRLIDFGPNNIGVWHVFSGQTYWDSPVTSGRINYTPTSPTGAVKTLSFERDAGASRIRVDGTVEHSGSGLSGTMSGTSILRLGALATGASYWLGWVSDFVIWQNATDAAGRAAALA